MYTPETVNPAQPESEPTMYVAELRQLVAERRNPAETLNFVVRLIYGRLRTNVCSVYLLEPDRAHLVLAATQGLRPESVRKVRMSLQEGLAGLVAQESRPIMVEDAMQHARFKHFPEAGEDAYHSFLGLPLLDRGLLQGVLVVQTAEPREFTPVQVQQLVDIAAPLGPIVSEVRTIEQLIAPDFERLCGLSRNLWWCWETIGETLFRALNPVR